MRNILDKLYLYSGYLSAFFLVLIALTILAQIIGRFVNITIDSTETAGFSMAAVTFLGLAYTFRTGEHIRVTLFTRLLSPKIKRFQEIFALIFCIISMTYLVYWAFDFVYFSFIFDDISPGLLAIPFWIPRLAMALGTLVFLVALLDDLYVVYKKQDPSYIKNATPVFKDTV
ncbi:TRAP transporter small permease [Alphaproteobacteria bacterium]|nr:TRAP transporter small permease [Alphaproteobacteria bacterium]